METEVITAIMKDRKNESHFPREVTLQAGTDRPAAETEVLQPFSAQAVGFLDAFSQRLRQDSRARLDAEVMALAFWCRRAHVLFLQKKHEQVGARIGRGRLFHLAPANVPMMFVYTWAIGLLAGNTGVVRISERTLQQESVQDVLRIFRELFSQEQYAAVRERTSFISYARSDAVTQEILAGCDGRVLWGGDETIRHMQQIPMSENAVELTFPDRVSLAVISEEALEKADEETLRNLVHRFYNDTYVMDQNGCSSPQTVIWLNNKNGGETGSDCQAIARGAAVSEHRTDSIGSDGSIGSIGSIGDIDSARGIPGIREKWWSMLAQEAEREYPMDGFRAARKLEKAAIAAMQSDEITSIRRYGGNALYVLRLRALPEDLAAYKGGFGLFYETEAADSAQIFRCFSPRIQTVVCIGIDPAKEAAAAERQQAAGALRFVEAGQALQMDTVWDGIDLIDALSQKKG